MTIRYDSLNAHIYTWKRLVKPAGQNHYQKEICYMTNNKLLHLITKQKY